MSQDVKAKACFVSLINKNLDTTACKFLMDVDIEPFGCRSNFKENLT